MFEVGKFKHLSSTAFWHYAKVCNNQCFNRKGKVPRPRALPWIGWCGTNYTLWALLLPISSGPPRMLTIRFNLNQPLFEKGKVTVCGHFCSHWPSQSWGERARRRSWKVKMADRKSCDQCPKTFASGGSLWNHKQTHSGVRRYNCSQCNKSSFEDPLPHSHWGETTRQEI